MKTITSPHQARVASPRPIQCSFQLLVLTLLLGSIPQIWAAGKIAMMPSYTQNPSYATIGVNQSIEVWGRAWGGTAPYTATMSYGDGTSNTWTAQTEAQVNFYIGAAHTYSTAGSKTATLRVTDNTGSNYVATAMIRVLSSVAASDKVNMAVDKGLLYMYKNPTSKSATQAYWYQDGTEGGLGITGFVLLAFEENGHLPGNDYQQDIYAQLVQLGLNNLASHLYSYNLAGKGALDSNGNSRGLNTSDSTYPDCLSAAALIMAFTSSNAAKAATIPAGIGSFAGTDYFTVVQDMLDSLYVSQGSIGGWHYSVSPNSPDSDVDGSTHQWPNIVMLLASERWNLPILSSAITRSMSAFATIQGADGGCGYTSANSWENEAKTGGMLAAFTLGNKMVGSDSSANRALQFVATNWNNDPNPSSAGGGWAGDFYAMYGVKKGLQLQGVTTLVAPNGTHDWYQDMSGWLLGDATQLNSGVSPSYRTSSYAFGQNSDGSWNTGVGYLSSYTPGPTAVATLVLTKSVTKPLPVPVIASIPDQSAKHPAAFILDGSDSYHMDPNSSIVQYQWILGTTNFNWNSPTTNGMAVSINPNWTNAGAYPVTLRVADNNNPVNYALSTIFVNVTTNPLAPVAVAIPPSRQPQIYSGRIGSTIYLDGSASYDLDGYAITNYLWDLNGDGQYGTAADAALDTSGNSARGTNASVIMTNTLSVQISLMVTANGISSSNNTGIDIYAAPSDLSVFSISAAAIVPNTSATVYTVLTNDAASGQSFNNVLVKFYNGNPFTSGTQLGSNYNVNLPIGGAAIITNTFSLAGGITNIYVYLDPNNAIQEWNESNNVAGVNVSTTIGPPLLNASISNQGATNQAPFSFTFAPSTFSDTNGFTLSYTASNLPPGLTINSATGTISGTPTNAGSYQVTVVASDGEYPPLTTNTSFTISVAQAAVSIALGNLAQIYNGTARAVTATTTPLGLPVTLTYNAASAAPTNVGSYTVVGTISDSNYVGSVTNTLVVSPGTAPIVFSGLSQVYDGTAHAATATPTPANLLVTLTYNGLGYAPTNAGNYTVIGTVVDSNWVGAATNTLVITKAPATGITLTGLAPTYDGTLHLPTITTIPPNLPVNLTYNGSSTPPTNAGTYTVIATIADPNYSGSVTNTYVIAQASASLTLSSLSYIYDAAGHTPTATTVPAGLAVSYTYNGLSAIPTNARTYTVVGTIADTNYSGSTTTNLVISPTLLTVTANNTNRIYGTNNPAFTLKYTGFAGADTTNQLTALPTASTLATAASPLGNYTISVAGGSASNYYFTNISGTLAITKAPLLMVGQSFTRGYGQTNPPFTATVTGVMNGDNITPRFTINANTNTPPGQYKISLNVNDPDAKLGNYNSTNISGYLSITNALLTGTVASQSRTYGQTNAPFSVTYTGFVNGQDTNILTDTLEFSCVDSTNAPVDTNTPVGNYDIAVTNPQSAQYYTVVYIDGNLAVNPAPLGVTAHDATRVYGAPNPAFSASITGYVNNEGDSILSGTLALNSAADTNASVGPYNIVPSGLTAPNYTINYTNGTLTVTAAPLVVSATNQSRLYGAANPPFGGTLVGVTAGDNLTATFGTAAIATTPIGTYDILPVWQDPGGRLGNYQVTTNKGALTILPAPLQVVANNLTRTYGNTNPILTGTLQGVANSEPLTAYFTTVATPTSTVGSYAVVAAISDPSGYLTNYIIQPTNGTLNIIPALLTVSSDNQSRVYGGNNPPLTGALAGVTNNDPLTVSFVTAATNVSPVGSYAILPSWNNVSLLTNYTVTTNAGSLTVTQAVLTASATNQSRPYGQTNPPLLISYSGFVNGDTVSCLTTRPVATTTATPSSWLGGYPITVANGLASNYVFTYVPGTLTVNKANLLIVGDDASRAYGQPNPAFTATMTGNLASDGIAYDLSTSADTSSSVGLYDISIFVSDPNNRLGAYDLEIISGTLTVTNAPLIGQVVSQTRAYGQTNAPYGINYTGFVNGEDTNLLTSQLTFTCLDSNNVVVRTNTRVGVYAIRATGQHAPNYAVIYTNGTLTVTQAVLAVTASNATRLYGAANPTFGASITGFVNNETASVISGQPSLTTSATTNSPVRNYCVVATNGTLSAVNYSFVFTNATLSVTPASLLISADPKTRVYGQTNPPLTATFSGLVAGDTAAALSSAVSLSCAATNISPVGPYSIAATNGSMALTNYSVSFANNTLNVTKASLSAVADAQSRAYGTANPVLTISYTGFVNSDGAGSLQVPVTASTTATNTSPVGSYTITLSGGTTDTNYSISLTNGTLRVTNAVLIASAVNTNRLYGAANPQLTIAYTGLMNGETASVLQSQPSISTAATNTSPIGAYPITLSGGSDTNYFIVRSNGVLTVNPAPLLATADPKSRAYGQPNPALTISYAGFLNGDTNNVLTTPIAINTTAQPTSPIGHYPITLSGGAASNYSLALSNGTLTVAQATLTITASNATRTYGLANPAFAGSISGLLTNDSLSASYSTSATNTSPAGVYDIVPTLVDSTGVSSNYSVSLVNGKLTVIAALTLTPTPGFYIVGNDFLVFDPAFIDTNALVADGGSLNFNGASLLVTSVTNAAAQDALAIASQGTNSSQIGIAATNITYGGVTVGSFSGGSGTNALALTFNTNASSTALSALLRQVTFATPLTNTPQRSFHVALTYSNITVAADRSMVLDRPPVALPQTIPGTKGQTISIPFSMLLTNDYDVDGDPLTVVDSSRVCANGGYLTMTTTNFIYRPPSHPTNQDNFAYVIDDGKGGEAVATVTLMFNTPTNTLQLDTTGIQNTGAKLSMMAVPGRTYQILTSTNLINWTLMNTVTATPTGLLEILDTNAKNNPKRFYKALAQ